MHGVRNAPSSSDVQGATSTLQASRNSRLLTTRLAKANETCRTSPSGESQCLSPAEGHKRNEETTLIEVRAENHCQAVAASAMPDQPSIERRS